MIKYFLELVPNICRVLTLILLTLFMINKCQPKPVRETPRGFIIAPGKTDEDILKYNYETMELEYRIYGKPPKLIYERGETPEDIIYHRNIEVEDLIEYSLY